MDALEIVMNKENAIPYFQPVISADRQEVIGYEVHGFFQTDAGDISLASFFKDDSIPFEYRAEVDDWLQEQAIDLYLVEQKEELLFINIDVDSRLNDGGEQLINKLLEKSEQGLSPNHIVFAMKEHAFLSNLDGVKHFVQYAQALGFLIAISEVGQQGTSFEHIVSIKPNIININVDFLDDSSPELYRDALYSLSMLSKKIGASLMFEHITHFQQLNYAWRQGARYYQGQYLDKAKPQFVERDKYKDRLQKDFHHFMSYERKKIEAQISLTNEVNQRLEEILKNVNELENYDDFCTSVATALEDLCFRVYICNQDGFQLSSNIVKNDAGVWECHQNERKRNWSWRPYFLENIVRMNIEQKGILSDLYTDIHKNDMIRTYAYPVNHEHYLFIDIPYSYLFEKDFLL